MKKWQLLISVSGLTFFGVSMIVTSSIIAHEMLQQDKAVPDTPFILVKSDCYAESGQHYVLLTMSKNISSYDCNSYLMDGWFVINTKIRGQFYEYGNPDSHLFLYLVSVRNDCASIRINDVGQCEMAF